MNKVSLSDNTVTMGCSTLTLIIARKLTDASHNAILLIDTATMLGTTKSISECLNKFFFVQIIVQPTSRFFSSNVQSQLPVRYLRVSTALIAAYNQFVCNKYLALNNRLLCVIIIDSSV